MGKKGGKKGKMDPAERAREEALEMERQEARELGKKAVRLQSECAGEERLYNTFLQEREKVNYFWRLEKKTLAEKQSELRNQERQLQDQEERHQIELKMFQGRLKHLRFHEHDELAEVKAQNEYKLKLEEDSHRLAEAEMKRDKNAIQKKIRGKEVSVENYIRSLKLEQDSKIHAMRVEFDGRARDLQGQSQQKMRLVREEMEKQRRQQVAQLEDEYNLHIGRVMGKNSRDFQDIKLYYGDITSGNLELIKRLKEEHGELKKRQGNDGKQMSELLGKNRKLGDPLKQCEADVARYLDQMNSYQEIKRKLADVKAKINAIEGQIQTWEFRKEVLTQQKSRVQAERDELYDRYQKCIYQVQQKTGLKNLLLEKKKETLGEALEIADAQVSELLVSAGLDPAKKDGDDKKEGEGGKADAAKQQAASTLEDIIRSKNDVISVLHGELRRVKELQLSLVSQYERKMALYALPADELGFKPIATTKKAAH